MEERPFLDGAWGIAFILGNDERVGVTIVGGEDDASTEEFDINVPVVSGRCSGDDEGSSLT